MPSIFRTRSESASVILLSACLPFLVAVLPAADLSAADASVKQAVQSDEPAKASQPKVAGEGYYLQLLDEPLTPFEPVKKIAPEEQMQADARAHFMAGRLLEARNEFADAYEQYKLAAQLAPNSLPIYQALIPLAFSLNQSSEAMQFALKAVELDPNDYELMNRLGNFMARQGRVDEAIDLLERALHAETLKKQSPTYVTVMHQLAILYTEKGNADKAADSYKVIYNALQDPKAFNLDYRTRAALTAESAQLYEHIGQAFLNAKRPEEAREAFERAAKENRGSQVTLSFNLAQVYRQTGEYDKALAELDKYFKASGDTKGQEPYLLLATILDESKRKDELIPRLEKLLEGDSENTQLQLFMAEQYLKSEQLEKAEKLFRHVADRNNGSEAYTGLVAVYRRMKQPEQLLDALKLVLQSGSIPPSLNSELEALTSDSELLDGLVEVGRSRMKTNPPTLDFGSSLVLAKLAALTERTSSAIELYEFAIASRRDPQGALHDEFARYLMSVDEYEKAAEVYGAVADERTLAPRRTQFLVLQAQALEMAGKTDAAIAAIETAKQDEPDHPLVRFQEAWTYYHARRYEKAVELFGKVVADFPDDPGLIRRCRLSLSNIYVQMGDSAKGEAVLEEVLASAPDDPTVNNDLGYLYADAGKNLERAHKMIEKALAAEPDNPAYLDSMGWVLYRLGQFEKAITYLQQASEQPGGRDATIFGHLGDCYIQTKEPDKARAAFDTALELARSSQPVDDEVVREIEAKLKQLSGTEAKPAEKADAEKSSSQPNGK